jgi:hypothetical protein
VLFRSYIQVYDNTGTLVAEDDDGGRRTNSRLLHLFPPGNYTSEISSYSGEQTGEYEIEIREMSLLTEPENIQLGSDDEAAWTIRHPLDGSGHRVARYTFRPNRDQMVTILLVPDDRDTYCRLELTGRRRSHDETSINIDDGCVIVTEVRDGVTYELEVIGELGDEDAGFLLAPTPQVDVLRWNPLELNREARGHITWHSPYTEWNAPGVGFTFDAERGDRLTVRVYNTELDARVVVTDPEGNAVFQTTDSRDLARTSGVSFTAPHDGWYRLIVTGRNRWFDTFTLRVNRYR